MNQSRAAVEAASYWQRLRDGRIQCMLCPYLCRLREGDRGARGFRARRDGDIVLQAARCFSGLRVEPIEGHSINHFLPGTLGLSVGRGGSNLRSRFGEIGKMSDEPDVRSELLRKAVRVISWQLLEEFGDHYLLAERLGWGPDAFRAAGITGAAEQPHAAHSRRHKLIPLSTG